MNKSVFSVSSFQNYPPINLMTDWNRFWREIVPKTLPYFLIGKGGNKNQPDQIFAYIFPSILAGSNSH